MSARTAGNKDHAGAASGRKHYDKELVRERTLELLDRRLGGTGKDQGARLVWDCPACGKPEKYSVKKAEGKGGCLVQGCRLAGYDDVFGMLAKLEGLDYHADFLAVLARAYELLGLEPAAERHAAPPKGSANRAAGAPQKPPREAPRAVPVPPRAAPEDGGSRAGGKARSEDVHELLDLASRVYARILELCPLETRDRRYLRTRGLSYETIRKGRFATMTAPRARRAKAVLQREFGREDLLSVPGFSEDERDGRLKFTLTGEFLLIPYHDAEGRVTTIEGRCVGEPSEGMGKYVSLRRSGNHLYLFPGHRPEDLLAVCEGAMGAIVAAECGLSVGAIQGCERFRASLSEGFPDGGPGDPLLELKGADFGGRTVPYIPDADDPPNPNVLKAAPKAARWIAEPQNGRPAICLLPKGADLDEWLLSLDPAERGARFAELLAGATPPEDGAGHGQPPQPPPGPQPHSRAAAAPGPPEAAQRDGVAKKGGRVLTAADVAPRAAPASHKRQPSPCVKDGGPPGPQPGSWDEASAAEPPADGGAEEEERAGRRGVSRGARKVRDEVYRAMLEALPPKEEHVEALQKRGVMRATVRVGRFGSLDAGRAKKVASDLAGRFGAKRLLSVPGFESDGVGRVRLSLASPGEEHLLVPCFDAEGLLSGVEALRFEKKTGEIEVEETVPLKGAGSHLYVFAHYGPGEVEGFCEGPLGALLAAQEDVVVGAIGGFRRYRAAAGPSFAQGRQPVDAVLPELEGVDFDGRPVAYVPRAGAAIGEQNARYHEAATAARWLVERQNGRPAVLGLRGDEEPGEDRPGAHGGPTSLGEWILSLPEGEARDRLRELFPESSAREAAQESEDRGEEAGYDEEDVPPPLPSRIAYGALALAAVVAALLDALLIRLESFAGYVEVGPGGEQVLYAGALGPLRRLADSAPFDVLHELHAPVAFAAGLALALVLTARARRGHLARWRASRIRLEGRWELHLTPGKTTPPRHPLAPAEALAAALAWPVAFVLSGWIIPVTEALLSLAARLRMAPEVGTLTTDPTLISAGVATLLSAFVLWRRRSIRAAEVRMLQGKIRH